MNERIGKLAVEAGALWHHGDWNMPSCVYFGEKDLEKFAELIVKECAGICECECEWNGDADTFAASEAYNECADAIKEHFGVEE